MDYNTFFTREVPELLSKLDNMAVARWGSMKVDEMLDHLLAGIAISLKDVDRKITTPEDKLPAFRQFLMSDRPFGKNLPKPAAFDDYPKKNGDINTKKMQLMKEVMNMLSYFEKHPDHSAIHSSFGRLNVTGWKHLHKKHFTHHFNQFGVLKNN